MVSAYASASRTATPRTFPLVVADDVSQNALSTFVGAFIFSAVSLTAVKNDYFEEVPELSVKDLFDDAFTAIGRDGAALVEVSVRLQKTLHTLALIGDADMREAADFQGQLALKRAQLALTVPEDLAVVRDAASFALHSANASR